MLEQNQSAQALHEATDGRLISIDCKALRRSFAKRSGTAMLHLVSAGASENGLSLGQLACAEQSNESPAIPELPKYLSLKGCTVLSNTVTIDAAGFSGKSPNRSASRKGMIC